MPDARPTGCVPDLSLPLAVTMGDPAGIGPDIALMSWLAREQHALPSFVLYGDEQVVKDRARVLGLDIPVASVASIRDANSLFAEALPVRHVTALGAAVDGAIITAIEDATAAVIAGDALALVTNPIAKKSLHGIALEYPGHTAFLGLLAARHYTGRRFHPTMMLVADDLKVVPTTVHIPLSAVASKLTTALITRTVRTTASALAQDFGIAHPRIVVAGLNPHAGEGGLIGTEEARIIAPAIAHLAAAGIAVTGPLSADTLFHEGARKTYDAAVTMYHDQALIPLKTLAFDRGVNVTLGLPFVRTSPDHGTAFALAGTGKARPYSFIAALRLAAQLAHSRHAAAQPPTVP